MLRLGWIADYFSRPVLIGYLHGVAIVLVVSQLGKLLGLDVDARGRSGSSVRSCASSATSRAITLASARSRSPSLLPLRFVAGRFPQRCSSSSARSRPRGCSTSKERGVAVVGSVPSGSRRRPPDPAAGDVVLLLPAAVGIFLVAFADEILTARSFAGKHHQHVRAPQELLAIGAANGGRDARGWSSARAARGRR